VDFQGLWLVVGLARSGCAAGALLRRRGARVLGVDDASLDDVRARWEQRGLTEQARVAFDDLRCGPGWDAGLPPLAGVVLSPGVPGEHPGLDGLRGRVPVIGELELGWRCCAARAVAVTGTNGKTTTTELTAHLLRTAGLDARALGNVGRPFCDVADALAPEAVAVLECSSFQLETIDTFRPVAGAVLNLAPDHLDRYPDLASYYAAKRRLLDALGDGGLFVTWTGCDEALSWPAPRRTLFGDGPDGASVLLHHGMIARLRADGPQALLPWDDVPLTGAPNLLNVLAAVALTEPFDLPADVLAAGLRTFRGLEHRQQTVARRGGVVFVDDSKATNVHAVCAGLAGYRDGVVLIVGGSGKGEDYAPLRAALDPVAHVILIGAEGPALGAALDGARPLHRADDLEGAVALGAELAAPGGTVLLSPACASFDMFRDYHHRGQVFRDAARALPGAVAEGDA